jgi:hypothetical protein
MGNDKAGDVVMPGRNKPQVDLHAASLAEDTVRAVAAGQAALLDFAGRLMAVLPPLIEQMTPFLQNLAAAVSEKRYPDYEDLLIEFGHEPLSARLLSISTITGGRRDAAELTLRRRKLGSALRGLANAPDQSTKVISRRAAALEPLLDKWTRAWIENSIDRCGLQISFEDFQDLVRRAAHGEPPACARFREIAPLIFRHVPKARGASYRVATVTHALLLVTASIHNRGARYTWSEIEGDFTDRLTAATRRQFQQPRFSPRPATKLIHSLKWIEGKCLNVSLR